MGSSITSGPAALKSSGNGPEDSKELNQKVIIRVVLILSRLKSPKATTRVHLRHVEVLILATEPDMEMKLTLFDFSGRVVKVCRNYMATNRW